MRDRLGYMHDRRGRFARSAGVFGGLAGALPPAAQENGDSRTRELIGSLARVGQGGFFSPYENRDSSMDWSTLHPDDGYAFEATGDDGDTVDFDLPPSELSELHAELERTIAEGADEGSFIGAGDDDHYFEWSKTRKILDEQYYTLKVGKTDRFTAIDDTDGEEYEDEEKLFTEMEMSERDMTDWHTQLTITLLTEQARGS